MTYRFDIEQNTDEWLNIKIGKFSASTANDLLMAKTNKGYQKLINRIVEERITGMQCENITFKGNWATDRGHELEPIARADFEFRNLQVVKTVGVVEFDDWVLCSPDGLINDDKLHQIKCPIFSTHLEFLKTKKIATNYYNQLQFELFVTGRKSNIYTSYHPKLKAVDIEVFRDEAVISLIDFRLKEAKKEVEILIKQIKNYADITD